MNSSNYSCKSLVKAKKYSMINTLISYPVIIIVFFHGDLESQVCNIEMG